MRYKGLDELRNQYPTERNINQSYENKNNSITYKGRYQDNSLTFSVEDVSGLETIADTTFQFILKIDGTEYTSPSFKKTLQDSLKSGNPYIQKSSVTRIQLTQSELLDVLDFSEREKYAEVEVTKNLKSLQDIIKHIDWLVSSRQSLREINEYGEYNLFTTTYDITTDSGLGFPNEGEETINEVGGEYNSSNEEVSQQPPQEVTVKKTLSITNTTQIPIRFDVTNPITNNRTPQIDFRQYSGLQMAF